jgi:hypothetical protein
MRVPNFDRDAEQNHPVRALSYSKFVTVTLLLGCRFTAAALTLPKFLDAIT